MKYWDEVYSSKPSTELGWYQRHPEISLSLIEKLTPGLDAGIIDVGGGDSSLTEFLLQRGFNDLSVLDVSKNAIDKSRVRLGPQGALVDWITTDIVDFKPRRRYDLWHDRACFHFLTSKEEVSRYVQLTHEALEAGGHLIIGAFSVNGPERCSGLPVHRYDKQDLEEVFSGFELIEHRYLVHHTPTGNEQNYIFCLFKAKQ